MFHPNIYTQKTTAFQKNCGFSVPLYIKGFEALSTYSTWIVERKICFYCWNISADSLAL